MIRGTADHVEAVRPELTKGVEHVTEYVATDLPEPGPAVRIAVHIAVPEHRALLIKAMRLEAARDQPEHAIPARSCPPNARTCLLSGNPGVASERNHKFGQRSEANGHVRTGAAAGDPPAGP